MLTFDQLLLFSGASILLIFAPGPDNIYVLTRGITQGRGAALSAAMGFALGNFAHTFFAVVGISAIVASSAKLFLGVKLAGAAYLIYVGYNIFKSSSVIDTHQDHKFLSNKAIFRQSIIANILNPKVAIFFLAFFPQFVVTKNGHTAIQMTLLGTTFVVLTMFCFGFIALASGSINGFLKRSPKASSVLNKIAGSVLIALGLKLAMPEGK